MTAKRETALIKFVDYLLGVYADTQDSTDVSCLVNTLVEKLVDITDEGLIVMIDEVIEEDLRVIPK